MRKWKIVALLSSILILILIPTGIIIFFNTHEAIPSSDVGIRNNYAYVSNTRGLAIFEIVEETKARKVNQINFDETGFGISIVDNILYISGGFGIKIFDLNDDPINPDLLGEYNKLGGNQIHINETLAFLTFINGGMEIIDIQNPENPVLVGQFNIGDRDMDVEVVDNIIYLADPDRGLEIVNGTNVSNPQIISILPIYGAWDIWRDDNLLYLGCHANGVRIVDISTPSSPIIIGQYPSDGDVYAVAGNHDVLYVGNFYGRIEVLNVSNPFSPTLLAITSQEYSSHGMYYDGMYAYLVGHHTQFSIIQYDVESSVLLFHSEITTKITTWSISIVFIAIFSVLIAQQRYNKN